MSRRNVVWLLVIVVVGVGVGVLAGWLWGVVAAVGTLVVSEAAERSRRARLRRVERERPGCDRSAPTPTLTRPAVGRSPARRR